MSNSNVLMMGAVAYDPKVITIWEGFKSYLRGRGLMFDYLLYSNYERQVEDHFAGNIHIAWNSPLAWIRTRRLFASRDQQVEALVMRDSDQDLTSLIVIRANSSIAKLADLKGRRVAVGAIDSPQATLIPLSFLRDSGLKPFMDFDVEHNDLLAGKHGDHIGGEREAARSLMSGQVDAACMLDSNHLLFGAEGTFAAGATRILAQTKPYDHCNFTVGPSAPRELTESFRDLLLEMSYEDSRVRPLLDLEGLKEWRPARVDGYLALEAAVNETGFYDDLGQITIADYRY